MELLFKHFWIVLVAVTIANGLIFKFRAQQYIVADPGLKEGYDKLFKGWLLWGNIPWIIIGIGNLCGFTNSVFAYFRPRELNPMVLLFHVCIIVIYVLSVKWIYFRNGAEFLEQHPGFFNKSFLSDSNITAKQIKIFFPLMLVGGIIGMVIMWVVDIPVIIH